MPNRDKALNILTQIESEAEARGELRGYKKGVREGFRMGAEAGFQHAEKAINEALMDAYMAALDLEPPKTEELPAPKPPARSLRKSGKAITLQLIEHFPGLTGVELVERSKQEGTPLEERALRTALHRLRHKDKLIINKDGKWYRANAAYPAQLTFEPKEAPSGET
jgi:hypothetical protein